MLNVACVLAKLCITSAWLALHITRACQSAMFLFSNLGYTVSIAACTFLLIATQGNIRGLLGSLQTVLWDNSGWVTVSVGDLLEINQVGGGL